MERAIETVKEALRIYKRPIYVRHKIVHNRHVIKELEELGAIFVETIDEIPAGSIVIYSAHGIPPTVREEAKKKDLTEIDATCGLVTKVHSAVKRFSKQGRKVIVIGHRSHVEVKGIVGEAKEQCIVIESLEEAKELPFNEQDLLSYVTQTTLSLFEVEKIAKYLENRFKNIVTLPTSSICYATTNRQSALGQCLPTVDLLYVIGDPDSSNSCRLVELGQKNSVKSYLISDMNQIELDHFRGVDTMALTAGASTPEPVVQSILDRIVSLNNLNNPVKIEIFSPIKEDVHFALPI